VCKSAVLPFEGKNVVVYSLGGVDADAGLCRVATTTAANDAADAADAATAITGVALA
jgi:hypothetical protein